MVLRISTHEPSSRWSGICDRFRGGATKKTPGDGGGRGGGGGGGRGGGGVEAASCSLRD